MWLERARNFKKGRKLWSCCQVIAFFGPISRSRHRQSFVSLITRTRILRQNTKLGYFNDWNNINIISNGHGGDVRSKRLCCNETLSTLVQLLLYFFLWGFLNKSCQIYINNGQVKGRILHFWLQNRKLIPLVVWFVVLVGGNYNTRVCQLNREFCLIQLEQTFGLASDW